MVLQILPSYFPNRPNKDRGIGNDLARLAEEPVGERDRYVRDAQPLRVLYMAKNTLISFFFSILTNGFQKFNSPSSEDK